jgi:hypothetical protein
MPSAGLREVVRAEAEELGGLRDLVRRERAARDLDHRADAVGDLDLLLGLHLLGDFVDDGDLQIQFLLEADERDHDFGLGLDALLVRIGGGLEHGARLHAVISGYLMPRRQPRKPSIGLNSCSSCTRCMIFSRDGMLAASARGPLRSLRVRQELVQRRVEETDRRREALQRLEDAEEVVALIRQQLRERGFAGLRGCRRESSRASRRCGRPRRTCARCG